MDDRSAALDEDVEVEIDGEGWEEKTACLIRAERDDARAAYHRPDAQEWKAAFSKMTFCRLSRHSRFWGEDLTLLHGAIRDLVVGLHGVCGAFSFVLNGTEEAIECWFGIEGDRRALPNLSKLLEGTFQDMTAQGDGELALTLTKQIQTCFVSGAPAPALRGAKHLAADRLCRGLFGSPWQYVIHAEPKARRQAFKIVQNLEAQSTELSVETDAADTRVAEAAEGAFFKALEALRTRAADGVQDGLWDVETWFCSPSEEVLSRGAALLTAGLSGAGSAPDPIRVVPSTSGDSSIRRPWWLSSRQLATLACPPSQDFPGYEILDSAPFGVQPMLGGGPSRRPRLEIAEILAEGRVTNNKLTIDLDDLTSHALVVGVTGSGKTNTCFQILASLAENNVPFLVIESAKSEYRELLRDARFSKKKPKIFTVGNETVSPLRINPFEVPAGTLIQTHIDYIKQLFGAAFVLYPPMPQVLVKSIEELYSDFGWNIARNKNLRAGDESFGAMMFPTFDDLVQKTAEVVNRSNYSSEIKGNVQSGLVERLDEMRRAGGNGPMFNTRQSLPAETLFGEPCIIELKALVSDDDKAFLMGLLLIRLYEYHEGRKKIALETRTGRELPVEAGHLRRLRHVTLIEEAHRLLRRVESGQSSEVSANPAGKAVEVFSNMLAEIRAFGEGIVMAEQIPTKLVTDALRNTNLKIIHRLLEKEDRYAVGDTMNLSDAQLGRLTRLQKGEAVVYAERLSSSVLVKVVKSPVKEEHEAEISDAHLLSLGSVFEGGGADRALRELPGPERKRLSALAREVYRSILGGSALTGVVEAANAFWTFRQDLQEPFDAEVASGDVFSLILEADIEARGRERRWRFAEMTPVIADLRRFAAALDAFAAIPDENRRDGLVTTWNALGLGLARLHVIKPAQRPFRECASCRAQCLYAPEVRRRFAPKAEEIRGFAERLEDREQLPGLFAQCIRQGRGVFPRAAAKAQIGAGYCYLVHMADRTGSERSADIGDDFWTAVENAQAGHQKITAPRAL